MGKLCAVIVDGDHAGKLTPHGPAGSVDLGLEKTSAREDQSRALNRQHLGHGEGGMVKLARVHQSRKKFAHCQIPWRSARKRRSTRRTRRRGSRTTARRGARGTHDALLRALTRYSDPLPLPLHLVVLGAPTTKKNSPVVGNREASGRTPVLPAPRFARWERAAHAQLLHQLRDARGRFARPLEAPVALQALVYRSAERGDLGNYLAAICDMLQAAPAKSWPGVVVNDKQIQSFDGSRLLIDRVRPRVELTLTVVYPYSYPNHKPSKDHT